MKPAEKTPEEFKVFISNRESTCGECGENLGTKAWINLTRHKGALCLSWSDMDHLDFLPSGDPALTRRARKHSILSAVVLKWSRARKRYERQGLLVESQALEKAETECQADQDQRARRQKREKARREELDHQYVEQFAQEIRHWFPRCPADRAREITEQACLKYSERIGRSSSAKRFDQEAIRLAVIAHIRHTETGYDRLLAQGWDRREARAEVRTQIEKVLLKWSQQKNLV